MKVSRASNRFGMKTLQYKFQFFAAADCNKSVTHSDRDRHNNVEHYLFPSSVIY